jgi:hypothetical protein
MMDGLTIRNYSVPAKMLLDYAKRAMPNMVDTNEIVYTFWGLTTRQAGGSSLEKARKFFESHGMKVKPAKRRKIAKKVVSSMRFKASASLVPYIVTLDPQGVRS